MLGSDPAQALQSQQGGRFVLQAADAPVMLLKATSSAFSASIPEPQESGS